MLTKFVPLKTFKPWMILQLFYSIFSPQSISRLSYYQLIYEICTINRPILWNLTLFNCMLFCEYRISYLISIVTIKWPLFLDKKLLFRALTHKQSHQWHRNLLEMNEPVCRELKEPYSQVCHWRLKYSQGYLFWRFQNLLISNTHFNQILNFKA